MSENCPFCSAPRVRTVAQSQNIFACGTEGPDINGEYRTGHICDAHMYNQMVQERDERIKELTSALREIAKEFVVPTKTPFSVINGMLARRYYECKQLAKEALSNA